MIALDHPSERTLAEDREKLIDALAKNAKRRIRDEASASGNLKPGVTTGSHVRAQLERALNDANRDPKYPVDQDIKSVQGLLARNEAATCDARDAFHAYDEHFLQRDVRQHLKAAGVRLDTFKAQLAVESGDFEINKKTGRYRGLAQMDADTLERIQTFSGRRYDLTKPRESLAAAAVLHEANLSFIHDVLKKEGLDPKIFTDSPIRSDLLLVAYNAGPSVVIDALRATKSKRPATWTTLMGAGADGGSLGAAMKKAYGSSWKRKFGVTLRYVQDVHVRTKHDNKRLDRLARKWT
ncbi:MAG: hypothetical protein H6729_06895 [Deltaproteobacteria bacterium]|nr:hypothetical protein [Deltaproteobacteria bacterium]